jgi:putative SOS response-associated peptidase YedK
MWVHLKNREPFGLAALWDVSQARRQESGKIQPIHNRMPVILLPEDEEQWLDASRTPFTKAKSLLKPYPEELMDAQDVSPIVNSAKYDGPECVRPASNDETPRTGQLSLL